MRILLLLLLMTGCSNYNKLIKLAEKGCGCDGRKLEFARVTFREVEYRCKGDSSFYRLYQNDLIYCEAIK